MSFQEILLYVMLWIFVIVWYALGFYLEEQKQRSEKELQKCLKRTLELANNSTCY